MGARRSSSNDDTAHDACLVHHGRDLVAGGHHGHHVQEGQGNVWTGSAEKP